MKVTLFGYKFREKGSKEYQSVVIAADNFEEANERFKKEVIGDDDENYTGIDVDKRTISWAGESTPLTYKGIVFAYGDPFIGG